MKTNNEKIKKTKSGEVKSSAKKTAVAKKPVAKKTTAKKTTATKTAEEKKVEAKNSATVEKNNTSAKKKNNNKLAYYAIFVIVVLLILYFVNFKKPNNNSTEVSENNVITSAFTDTDEMNTISVDNVKFYKQKSNGGSGPACIMMALSRDNKYGMFDLEFVEGMKSEHKDFHGSTCIVQMREIFDKIGVKYFDNRTYKSMPRLKDVNLGEDFIEVTLKLGYPIIVGTEEGVWKMVVGYDNKGTDDKSDDEVIVFDPTKDDKITMKVSDLVKTWNFGAYFKNEPSANNEAKNCFIITV